MSSDGELASGSRTEDNSYLKDTDTASNETNDYLAQVRGYDKAKEELLNSLVFYEGAANIQENYTAVSGVSGDTPVIGSAAMVPEDIMAYDPSTEKCYLLARRISLLGDSVKAFEFARLYSGTAAAKVTGILTEYYGNGVFQAYDESAALDAQSGPLIREQFAVILKRYHKRYNNLKGNYIYAQRSSSLSFGQYRGRRTAFYCYMRICDVSNSVSLCLISLSYTLPTPLQFLRDTI